MKQYHINPRTISKKNFNRLVDTLARLGDLSGVVHNLTTDEIIGGNQRSRVFGEGKIELVEKYDRPDEQGTVAHGFIIWRNKKYAYRQVEWSDEIAREANIAANIGAGDWDWNVFANSWDASELKSWGLDADTLKSWQSDAANLATMLGVDGSDEEENEYSTKVTTPIYEIKGDKPVLSELLNDEKFTELVSDIDSSDLPEDIKLFLRTAATRHIVFDFSKIAEYYAHADKPLQKLMEDSALVIIDFDRAIELGYVKLSEKIQEQFNREYPSG